MREHGLSWDWDWVIGDDDGLVVGGSLEEILLTDASVVSSSCDRRVGCRLVSRLIVVSFDGRIRSYHVLVVE